jgi:hypothetical protein
MRIRIDEELNNATFSISNLVEDQTLHGQKPSVMSKVNFGNFKLLKGYLIIAVSSRSRINNVTKWKIALNEIALTRTFRPYLEYEMSDKIYQALFVYDVSKILSATQPEAIFKLKYEGKEPITVNVASMITFHSYSEGSIKVSCIAEVFNLNNYVLDLSPHAVTMQRHREGVLYLGIVSEQNSEVKIIDSNGNNLMVHSLGKGFNFIESGLKHTWTNMLTLKCEDPLARHIFHCTAYTTLEYPNINIRRYSINNNYLELALVNESSTAADNCEIIVLKTGTIIQRLHVDTLHAGEERTIKMPLSNKISGKVTIRLIWRKALKVFIKDQAIELK